jgi:hypothetical protein
VKLSPEEVREYKKLGAEVSKAFAPLHKDYPPGGPPVFSPEYSEYSKRFDEINKEIRPLTSRQKEIIEDNRDSITAINKDQLFGYMVGDVIPEYDAKKMLTGTKKLINKKKKYVLVRAQAAVGAGDPRYGSFRDDTCAVSMSSRDMKRYLELHEKIYNEDSKLGDMPSRFSPEYAEYRERHHKMQERISPLVSEMANILDRNRSDPLIVLAPEQMGKHRVGEVLSAGEIQEMMHTPRKRAGAKR